MGKHIFLAGVWKQISGLNGFKLDDDINASFNLVKFSRYAGVIIPPNPGRQARLEAGAQRTL